VRLPSAQPQPPPHVASPCGDARFTTHHPGVAAANRRKANQDTAAASSLYAFARYNPPVYPPTARYAAAALCMRHELVHLVWIVVLFLSNVNSAYDFYRASADPGHKPDNKLRAGLRDSALVWVLLLPAYWWSESRHGSL
jgi:hypothetical protein